MLRATPGCLRMSPAPSSVRIIWWTEGGLTLESALQIGFGRGATEHLSIGVDKG